VTDHRDPLPESQWKFRRAFTYVISIVSLFLVGWIVHKLAEGEHLAGVAYGLIGLCALLATYYLIAPSAEALAKIIGHFSAMRKP